MTTYQTKHGTSNDKMILKVRVRDSNLNWTFKYFEPMQIGKMGDRHTRNYILSYNDGFPMSCITNA